MFHLWLKQSWLNHQKILKFNAHYCLQNFILLSMSLLTALIVKNTYILPGLCSILLENVLDQTRKAFNTKFGSQWKDRERSYQLKWFAALFYVLVARHECQNCVKVLRVKKIVKQIKFEGVLGLMKEETVSKENHSQNIWDKL